ncbi:methionyl-tRNA formyltransferase [Tunturiibacter empetritectus]|uniref:methionyl-tRNA formyltransferase n=1 Tax=Tunturiibacter empetritectus TaxID=3069691 RepID=UPI003D9B9ECF
MTALRAGGSSGRTEGYQNEISFCGTPEFAVPTLEAVIAAGHEIALVVTQPDRAAGRGLEVHVPPVKQAALQHGLSVVQPEKIKNNLELRGRLEEIKPDAILVVAYGRIIPQWMLELPRFGNINLHGSLLPKYRGAAPIQWAVACGELVTGVTTMRLDAGLDTGDMLLAAVCPVGLEETAVDVYGCLAPLGAELMVETLKRLEAGTICPEVQNHSLATLAPILKREDGLVDFSRSAKQIYDRWRGFQPWPGAHTTLRGKKLIVSKMRIGGARSVAVGELLVDGEQMLVGCAGGTVAELLEVQMEGKKRMSAAEFLRGYQVKSGERLGI